MRVASLTNRIFLACTLLAVLSLGFAFYFVNARATSQAEVALERELTDAASLVDQQRSQLTDFYTAMARVVADASTLKSAVDTGDPPTVQPLVDDYLKQMAPTPDLFVVSSRDGRMLAAAGTGVSAIDPAQGQGSIDAFSRFVADSRGLLHVVSVPIFQRGFVKGDPPDVMGRVFVGFFLDDKLAARLRAGTGSEIAFGADGRILAASLPDSANQPLAGIIDSRGIARVCRVRSSQTSAHPIRAHIRW